MTRAELYLMLSDVMREAGEVQGVSGYPAEWMHQRVLRILADKLAAKHSNFDRERFEAACRGEAPEPQALEAPETLYNAIIDHARVCGRKRTIERFLEHGAPPLRPNLTRIPPEKWEALEAALRRDLLTRREAV